MKTSPFFMGFTALITVLYSPFLQAQQTKLHFGMEQAIGLGTLRGNSFMDKYYEPRTSYMGGVYASYDLDKNFSLKSGLYIEHKGGKLDYKERDTAGRYLGRIIINQVFNYLTVPLLMRYEFGNKVRFFINTGPYVSFLVNQLERSFPFQSHPEITTKHTENFMRTDAGVSFGIGGMYPVKEKLACTMEFRENLGLTNVSKLPVMDDGTIKTNALYFTMGIIYTPGISTVKNPAAN